jgi:hypothetical protein
VDAVAPVSGTSSGSASSKFASVVGSTPGTMKTSGRSSPGTVGVTEIEGSVGIVEDGASEEPPSAGIVDTAMVLDDSGTAGGTVTASGGTVRTTDGIGDGATEAATIVEVVDVVDDVVATDTGAMVVEGSGGISAVARGTNTRAATNALAVARRARRDVRRWRITRARPEQAVAAYRQGSPFRRNPLTWLRGELPSTIWPRMKQTMNLVTPEVFEDAQWSSQAGWSC